ncbi:MAG TPA: hypothetical protein DIU29_03505, partial [Candidatus Jacksonbacteria bacterium]|nr:hypothetical protein [Candidatus Jacksonbacteria bacterium]
ACTGTWGQTDLKDGIRRFFDYKDLKPGDHGEDTVSLHVIGNDAWGKFDIANVLDLGNTCVDPETEATADADCFNQVPGTPEPDPNGELRENLMFSVWLDQGTIPGFQNNNPEGTIIDHEEGDNIWQREVEPIIITPGTIDAGGESYLLSDALKAVYQIACLQSPADGHTSYGPCHGIAEDGRMVGSAVYYFGIDWDLPLATGNEIQTDELKMDLIFKAVQQRNNPSQTF